jgi:hypothetical protein
MHLFALCRPSLPPSLMMANLWRLSYRSSGSDRGWSALCVENELSIWLCAALTLGETANYCSFPALDHFTPPQSHRHVLQSLGSAYLSEQSLFRQLKSGLTRLELCTYPSFCRPGSSSRRGITDQTSPKRLFHRPPTEPHTTPLFNLCL